MQKFLTSSPGHEFTTVSLPNWVRKDTTDWSSKYGHQESYSIVCPPNHDIMFPNFDEIITLDKAIRVDVDIENQDLFGGATFKKLVKSLLDKDPSYTFSWNGGTMPKEWHPYNWVFQNLTEEMSNGNIFFKPKKSDYLDIKKKVEGFNFRADKVVAISGRNQARKGSVLRNLSFESLIRELLSRGVAVLNCTVPSYNLNINHVNYRDVASDCISYSRHISYFVNADATIIHGSSGATSNHISTAANVILIGPTSILEGRTVAPVGINRAAGRPYHSWEHFGHKGKSMYATKKAVWPDSIHKIASPDVDKVTAILKNLEKPIVDEFFDETKIRSLSSILSLEHN